MVCVGGGEAEGGTCNVEQQAWLEAHKLVRGVEEHEEEVLGTASEEDVLLEAGLAHGETHH